MASELSDFYRTQNPLGVLFFFADYFFINRFGEFLMSSENRFFKLKIARPRNIRNDVLSGLTVALALVPEAVAFSFVAHVDPTIGLYAAFMMGLITAIFGGRPGMISGATGAVAVIFAPLVVEQTQRVGLAGATQYLFAAVILMGLIQILFGVLKFGKFIRMVPHPVMLGFVNGLAIIIFKAQFSQFYVGVGENAKLLATTPLLIMIGMIILTMLICHILPKFTKAVPATLSAIIIVSILAYILDVTGIHTSRTVLDFVKDIDPSKTTIEASLPSFALPEVPFSWETFKLIVPFSILAAAVGLIESLLTLALVDELTETRGRGNRESMAQGLANFVNGFFGGMGGCAMIGQSMINIRGGGRGRSSGIAAALFLLTFILWTAPYVEKIPLAALVGVMFMVVIATFEWSSFRILGDIPKSDAIIIALVSIITFIENLAIAVLVGVITSALVFAWKKSRKIYVTISSEKPGSKVYLLDGCLFFGSVASFKNLFDYHNDPENIVIDFAQSRVYDHSGLEAINNVSEKYASLGKKLHLYNLSPECASLIDKGKNIIEVSVIDNLDWHHLADDSLD